MLQLIVILLIALLAAGIYKGVQNRREHGEKLARIRREIERRARAIEQSTQHEDQP